MQLGIGFRGHDRAGHTATSQPGQRVSWTGTRAGRAERPSRVAEGVGAAAPGLESSMLTPAGARSATGEKNSCFRDSESERLEQFRAGFCALVQRSMHSGSLGPVLNCGHSRIHAASSGNLGSVCVHLCSEQQARLALS